MRTQPGHLLSTHVHPLGSSASLRMSGRNHSMMPELSYHLFIQIITIVYDGTEVVGVLEFQ